MSGTEALFPPLVGLSARARPREKQSQQPAKSLQSTFLARKILLPQAPTLCRASGRFLPFHHFPQNPRSFRFFEFRFCITSRLTTPYASIVSASTPDDRPLRQLDLPFSLSYSTTHQNAVETSNARGPDGCFPPHRCRRDPGSDARLRCRRCWLPGPGRQAPDRPLRPGRHLRDGSGTSPHHPTIILPLPLYPVTPPNIV